MHDYLRSVKLRARHLIVALVILQVAIAFLTDNFVLSFDESIWQYIGRNWFRNGLVPYSGGVDNKSPLIYILYGVSDFLFGVNYWLPRLLAIACQTTGIYFLYRLTKHIAGERAGIVAMTLYGLSLAWKSTNGKMVSLTQTYEIALLVISVYLLFTAQKRKHFFISGLVSGAAVMFRFSAAFTILLIMFPMIRKKTIPDAILFLLGVFTGIAAVLALFLSLGIDLHDLIAFTFSENFVSGSVTDHSLSWKLEQFSNAFFYSELILFYPFVIIYLLKKGKSATLLLWLSGAFVGISVIGMYAQAHLKELLPPLSIISALAVLHLNNTYRVPLRIAFIVIVAVFFPKNFEPLYGLKKLVNPRHAWQPASKGSYAENEEWNKELGLWIRSNTRPSEKVFVAGYGAQVQAYSCRLSPTIYFNVTQTAAAKQRLYSDLSASEPAMIAVPLFAKYNLLVAPDIRQFISRLTDKDYYLDRCLFSYNIYRKKRN